MRTLTVQTSEAETNFELPDELAEEMIVSGALYECGEGHDLHLNPEHSFNSEEVEKLLLL